GSEAWVTSTGVQSDPESGTGSRPAPIIRPRISKSAKQSPSPGASAVNARLERRWSRLEAKRLGLTESLPRANPVPAKIRELAAILQMPFDIGDQPFRFICDRLTVPPDALLVRGHSDQHAG